MSITAYSQILSTNSTPELLLTNPLGDGEIFLCVNFNGNNLFTTDAVIASGNISYWLTSGQLQQLSQNQVGVYLQTDQTFMYVTYVYNSPTDNGFYISSDNPQTNVTVNSWFTPLSMTGTITSTPMYNSSGLITNSKTWVGSTTTVSGGTFTIDISSAGFTSVSSVQVTALDNTSSAIAVPLTSLKTVSTTSVTGNVVQGADIIAGNTLVFSGTDLTVYVTVFGQ